MTTETADLRSISTTSSDVLEELEGRGFLVGDVGFFASRCADCEGSFTEATALVLCDWRATLMRFGLLELCASCDVLTID